MQGETTTHIVLLRRRIGEELLWEAWYPKGTGFQCAASGHDVAQVLTDARTVNRTNST